MITQDTIKKLATKYQTSEFNIAREYSQHLFLSYFYREKHSEKVLFKGKLCEIIQNKEFN